MAAGVWVGACILKDRAVWREIHLIPLRDLWGFVVWLGERGGLRSRLALVGQLKATPDRLLFECHLSLAQRHGG